MLAEKLKSVFSGKKSLFGDDPSCRFRNARKPLVIIIASVCALLTIVTALILKSNAVTALSVGIVILLLTVFTFERRKEFGMVRVSVIALVWACLIFWIMQLAATSLLNRIFLSDISGNITKNEFFGIMSGLVRIIMNTLIIYSLIMLISAIFRSMKVGLISVMVVSLIIGVANNFVVQSRGREISFIDLKSIGTAMSVVGDYKFKLAKGSVLAIILVVFAIIHIIRSDYPSFPGIKKPSKHFAIALTSLLLCVGTVFGGMSIGYASRTYRMQGTEYNGYYLNFIYSIKNSRVKTPATYSPGALINAIKNNDFSSITSSPTANVIVIMNESFSDIKGISDSLENSEELVTDVEILPYWNSLQNGIFTDENGKIQSIVKGNALSSVYGGNTANSEYEFLSGISMSFLPEGTVAYNGSVKESNAYTLVNFFNDAGYRTVAMHPETPGNWSRSSIYKYYGFDEIYFKPDFVPDLDKDDYFRGHVSDAAMYEKLIDLYENKEEGEKFFTFAITMMNHGGYNHSSFKDTVKVVGDTQNEAEEYFSSIHESDKALKDLIDYFSNVEEETLIVFFGDHQPTMPTGFLERYLGVSANATTEEMLNMYTIPYLFWANYEMDSDIKDTTTSIGFMSSEMLSLVGVRKSSFFNTLDSINKQIVAINHLGWYGADGRFHSFKDKNDTSVTDSERKALELYEHLVYNLVFDDKYRMESIFDTPKLYHSPMIACDVVGFKDFRKSPILYIAPKNV
ncbi:MAG: LTA synthase family protein [Clostridia bacterium]|nr:LTA synthase family protein [Clostridia bacterium]